MFQSQLFSALGSSIIITVLSLVVTFAIIFVVFRRVLGGIKQQNQLLNTGVPAEATILSLEDTGVQLNSNPQVRLVLEVRPTDRPSYQTETKCFVSFLKLAQLQPGSNVQVRVDPVDPSRVAVQLA